MEIVLVEDDPIVRESLRALIASQSDLRILHSYDNADTYLRNLSLKKISCDHLLLLDISLPRISGIEALPQIKAFHTGDVVILSTYEEEDKILQALKNGASSYISKREGLKGILEGIRTVIEGGAYLSPAIAREIINYFKVVKPAIELPERQKEVLESLVNGLSYQAIALKLSISVETVRSHVKKMYRQLHVSNKAEAIQMYNQGSVK